MRFMRLFPWCGALLFGLLAVPYLSAANGRLLTSDEARQLALLVARHDHIDVSDTHIEINSMDMGTAFIQGYASFIILRESMTPGPDETLRHFSVNRRTGDVWETTLCTHYSFPELARRQRTLTGRGGAGSGGIVTQQKEIGCAGKPSGSPL
jgi:hypothetical protein